MIPSALRLQTIGTLIGGNANGLAILENSLAKSYKFKHTLILMTQLSHS